MARALYGSPKHAVLLQRYNRVVCKAGAPLPEGLTLVMPATPTTLPDAKLRSMNPDVRARPGGGSWTPAAPGMPLYSSYNVNTLDQGRADVEFIDRTRVFLAPNTLVVIYGTASRTRVSKSLPVAVEVEAGEVKAGLAALRGDAVEVAIKGGGRVSAASRDTVVQRKGERTTVAVFDGKAGVSAGGKSVEVPKNHGTRFFGNTAPAPPRPLPPAPAWAGGAESVALADGPTGTITASWKPDFAAKAYRFEIARDPEFHDLVAREEVPGNVTSFRGEKLPVGTYYLAVRAIDKEEYLGIASETRAVRLVEAHLESGAGKLGANEIEANPYAVLRFVTAPNVEMALDDGPFGPMAASVDLARRAPRALRVRPAGAGAAETIQVRYTKVAAALELTPEAAQRLAVKVRFTGLEGVDIGGRVKPQARAHLPSGIKSVALHAGPGGAFVGSIDLDDAKPRLEAAAKVRVDVVDDRGAVLGTSEWAPPEARPEAPQARPQIGAFAPIWLISPSADVLWLAPTPPDGAAVSVGMARAKSAWTFQGQARASGSIGPVGLDAALRTDTADGQSVSGAAWLGGRVRVLSLAGSRLELSPALRVGLPVAALGTPVQIEPSVAVGGVAGRFTWLADAGARVRAAKDRGGTGTPQAQGFLVAGGTVDPLTWMRIHAVVDAHVVARDGGTKNVLAGFGAGVEAGTSIYGGLALHLAPWADPGLGVFTAQLALGFRGGR